MFVYFTDQAHNYADQAGPYQESKKKQICKPQKF